MTLNELYAALSKRSGVPLVRPHVARYHGDEQSAVSAAQRCGRLLQFVSRWLDSDGGGWEMRQREEHPLSERALAILSARAEGASLEEVGRSFGLTRAMVLRYEVQAVSAGRLLLEQPERFRATYGKGSLPTKVAQLVAVRDDWRRR